jgi:hypothetical protein
MCNGNGDEKRIKYVLKLRSFVVDKLPEDGTLVPKHVEVGTQCELYFVMYFVVL